ncbi:unnamed protein product [Mucor hiemalis]
MGTSGDLSQEQNHGIVPRFTENLFQWIASAERDEATKYQVKVSFLELYHEDIIDLLNMSTSSQINIREDVSGNITWSGVYEQLVENAADLLNCLYQGSLNRTTGSTDMNSNSSRSHAIFSVTLNQQLPQSTIHSKFHFVDLAGSERLKRTNAIGDRAKEGISINSGLLALGNVISALGDEKKKQSHVPYRNSKLTRLLQDSLGGNSQTLMLACVSPADSNANETLSTLKYANRAKNITNRVVLNQQLSEVDTMKQEIARLRHELKINDAFMKEVHAELDDLRAKNLALSNSAGKPVIDGIDETDKKPRALVVRSQRKQQTKLAQHSSSTAVEDDDDGATLVDSTSFSESVRSHRSTSTRRRKKNHSEHKKKGSSSSSSTTTTDHSTITKDNFSLDKHRSRTRKESLFIKQIKADNDASPDPTLFTKMLNLFQSSIREQKQLIHRIQELQQPVMTHDPPLKKKMNKPSLMRQPNAIMPLSNNNNMEETTHRTTRVVEENKIIPGQLKQINAHVKKAVALLKTESSALQLVDKLKCILQDITGICNTKSSKSTTTTTTQSSEVVIKRGPVALSNNTVKRVHVAESHREIQRLIAFDSVKSNTICAEICKSLKEKKFKLMREQKDLLKERKAMLKEFYKDDYAEQQQKQQYMDERIDVITVEVDFITEQLKLLQPTITSNKVEKSLIDIIKPLKEQDLRSLLFMVIQQDVVQLSVTTQLKDLTLTALERYQQGIVQLRRDYGENHKMNNQVIKDLLKSSTIKCLSNGLLLLNTIKS